MKKENLLCTVCGERTVVVENGVAVCGTCDHNIMDAVICSGCGNAVSKSLISDVGCGFCGCFNYTTEEEEVYAECKCCSSDYSVIDDVNGTGMCEDCREAYSDLGDDDLMQEICNEFNVYPYEVEFDRDYMEMTIGHMHYDVYDEDSVIERIGEYIKESLWAFSPWFLANETGIDQHIFEVLANSGECESLNEGIADIIEKTCGMDDFIDSAIGTDGLGHWTEDRFTCVGDYYLE